MKAQKENSLSVEKKPDNVFDGLPAAMRETMLILAHLTWAGDMETEGHGPEWRCSYSAADDFLRAHGLYPSYK